MVIGILILPGCTMDRTKADVMAVDGTFVSGVECKELRTATGKAASVAASHMNIKVDRK